MVCTNEKLPISKNINNLETDLGGWTIVIFACVTTGLLFYHMTRVKSLPMRPKYAAILANLLLLVAIVYSVYALYNFFQRTGYLQERETDECTKKLVLQSRVMYTIITSVVCLILIFISIQIFRNSRL